MSCAGESATARHPADRRACRSAHLRGAYRAMRLLRLAASRGGLRSHACRGDGARKARDRDRLLGKPRVHDADQQLPGRLHADAVGPNAEMYPADGTWAEPDLDHAATLMRQVWERPDDARAMASGRAGRDRAAVSKAVGRDREGSARAPGGAAGGRAEGSSPSSPFDSRRSRVGDGPRG